MSQNRRIKYVCYECGEGVRKNYKKAVEWYIKAAEHGVPEAMYNLVCFYEYGHGVKKDSAKALEWCIKAAEHGADKAQKYLAEL